MHRPDIPRLCLSLLLCLSVYLSLHLSVISLFVSLLPSLCLCLFLSHIPQFFFSLSLHPSWGRKQYMPCILNENLNTLVQLVPILPPEHKASFCTLAE